MMRLSCMVLFLWTAALGDELMIGTSTANITPDQPVALSGQFRLRIARKVESPITANVVALESRRDGKYRDAAVMVSCDLLYIPWEVLEQVRGEVKKILPDLNGSKIFINGTHTHTAPVLKKDKYRIPEEGVMQVDEYLDFLANRVAGAVAEAWKGRKKGSVSWGIGHAVVAQNRRAVYSNGAAQMYGKTDIPAFRSLEGYEDHDIGTFFFWHDGDEPVAVAVNVACPSQEVEGRSAINADFWHPVRESLKKRFGGKICVLGWTGAAGDQSPHLMYRKAADERMRRLRGLSRTEEIARRIVRAVEESYEVVQKDRKADATLVHKTKKIELPMRLVKEAEYREAKAALDRAMARIETNPKAADSQYRRAKWYEVTVKRFEAQKQNHVPVHEMELHVLRIGDAAICTSPFELYTDFGIRIKARSRAVQTFVIQLVGPGTYVPTEKAVKGGHYSAVVHSSLVGPGGGQVLVEKTVKAIEQLWRK